MSNHDLSNFVLQWWVAGLFQRHRVSTKIELTYLGASTRDTGLMGLDPESREMENVYKLIPDENSTVRRNYLRTWCAQEEFWRSPNVWKVSFWWCTVPYWRGTLTILWSDEREGSRSTRWRQRSRGRNIDDWRRGCRRWSSPERTTKQMVWLPNHHSVTYRWPCWQQSQRRSYDGLIWRILKKNWYDVTSWWLRHFWDTNLIEIIKTVCKWRQRQHCLSQYSRRRSRRVYQYDLKNRVREHDKTWDPAKSERSGELIETHANWSKMNQDPGSHLMGW